MCPDGGVGTPSWPDLNADWRLDLVLVGGSRVEVRLNSGGRFPTISYTRTLTDGRDVAVGDADGDGDNDIYVVQGSNATVPDLLLTECRLRHELHGVLGPPADDGGGR